MTDRDDPIGFVGVGNMGAPMARRVHDEMVATWGVSEQ